ncbi:single-stranded DNA-binding protein [Prochlorococcus sp. MIT 1341]|uniref:single-stranded DNA-binding protein n=1 Tax=Prochlorococcus sp. MIT 1341 TaxID=3096221 RepID=UPI002A75EE10|nr:single-stranded DNA-binding protein [Prochlorococcus sp. MIT 1341]
MNHCLLEVEVIEAPTTRYTQNNQTPIAEMKVQFDGLRADDLPGTIKVVGWGNLAQELQSRVSIGNRLLVEGRLRMNTVSRQDGTKEKSAEFTLSKFHPIGGERDKGKKAVSKPQAISTPKQDPNANEQAPKEDSTNWNSSPLIPDTDDIPF